MTTFGRLEPDGSYVSIGVLSQASMLACPFCIIDFEHYRADGTCKCDESAEQARLIREFDYTLADFERATP
jgi:hypothetical protein